MASAYEVFGTLGTLLGIIFGGFFRAKMWGKTLKKKNNKQK